MRQQEDDSMRARLLVVQPDPQDPLDRFAGLLTDAGLAVRVVRPFAGETLPDSLEEDGLLVLGGRMSVVDDDEYPWLADIRRLLCHAADLPRPALGICLGGQLLAQTFGGTVTVGDCGLEAGIVRIGWRPEARADALFANLPAPFLAGALHDDMVKTLPEISAWLGYSDMYPHQAFRVGRCAWGVQFHPEVSLAGYREWVSARGGTDPVALRRMRRGAADFQQLDDDVVTGISVLARRFADLVRALSVGAPQRSIRVGPVEWSLDQ
jgi:GMP synthase (glutamine-hydrolysing)